MNVYALAKDMWSSLNNTPERVYTSRQELTDKVRELGGRVEWYPAVACSESQRERMRAEVLDNLVKCRRLLREALEAGAATAVSPQWARDVQRELRR